MRVRARVHTEGLAPGASISLYLELRDGSGAPLRERRFGPTMQRIAHLVTAADRKVVDHRVSADDAAEARVCVYTTHEHGLQLVESLTVQDAVGRLQRKRSE